MRDASPKTIYLKDYKPPFYLIDTIDLVVILDESDTRVVSKLRIRKNPECTEVDAPLELFGEELLLDSIRLDDRELKPENFQCTREALILPIVPQGGHFSLEIETRCNPRANTALEGLYLSNRMFCTQCEAQGFRRITYYLDRPDVMAVFTTTLIADKSRFPVLLSNGNKIAQGELKHNRHWVKWEDPFKKPAYLFALVGGELDCVEDTHTTPSGRNIDLKIYVETHDLDKCDHAMRSLKKAMCWDEKVFGREYDLDLYMIVAVSHFNMGAMENKGLNIFNTKYVLARPDTATDADYEHIEGVIGHEYFHNWTGNRITCRDWFQLSLKEGLTVFRDQEFTADQTSRGVKRINDVNMLRTHQFAEDAGPLAHPVRPEAYIEINNFYTLTVYEKGAEVVRMIHTLLGSEGFRKGTDLYFQRFDGQAVTTDDFVTVMEQANQVELTQFRRWYSQAGTPCLEIMTEYDSQTASLVLNVAQNCPPSPGQLHKEPYHVPIRIALLGQSGNELPIHCEGESGQATETILEMTESNQQFKFENVHEYPHISIMRGFSAPVKLIMDQSLDELAFLLRHDSDMFNRWEAGQQLAGQILLDRIQTIQNGQKANLVSEKLIDAFRALLGQEWTDLSYLALLLTLPSERYISEQMPVVDVEAIYQARCQIRTELALELKELILEIYQNNNRDESGLFDIETVGRRRLKNTCLAYLIELEEPFVYDLSLAQYNAAKNMTDQLASLACIVNSNHPEKNSSLDAFYRQWQREALVVDKWFSLQASSPVFGKLETIFKLMAHPAFDLKNPNRVRSLIGAFSQANLLQFHVVGGRGYEFLADQVISLNLINPQVASRMLGAFSHWRRYDEHRQQTMRAQLKRIISTENISKDVYEIANKSLDF